MSRILKVYDKGIFQISDHFIKVVFPFAEVLDVPQNANGDDIGNNKKILRVLMEQPGITVKELSVCSSLSTRTIGRMIKELRESGKITRSGSARKDCWQTNK